MKGESAIFKGVYNMRFEDWTAKQISNFMPCRSFSNKYFFKFNKIKPCRFKDPNGVAVVLFFRGCYIIGTQTIAISSQSDVKILELADKVQNIENQKRRLLRKMDRSRRATNPDNYNEDGTIKKQNNKKVVWNKSNHYIKYQNELKGLYRKQANIRKYQHECLANYIISLGNKVYVEKMNFAGLQKRAKNTEKNDKGKFKRKKRFGKSLANKAPSMLLTIIDRKLNYFGEKLIKINTLEAKASQFNHFDGTYAKKSLSQRWNYFNGIKVQRDMYSSKTAIQI